MVKSRLAHEAQDCYYVYVIFHPVRGEPIYVGKGQRNRWRTHARKSHNLQLRRTYEKYGELPIVKVREGLSHASACETEIAFIRSIGRAPNGPLVNATDGGEGCLGQIQSEQTRQKKREKLAGRPRPPHVVEAVKLAWKNITPERRARMSAAQRGRGPASVEKRTKQSVSHLKRRGRSLEDIGSPGTKLTSFQRELLGKPALTKAEMAELCRARSIGNKYGLGNKLTPKGAASVSKSTTESNKRRNKSGKPTVHKGARPWLDEGMSRTSWYRKRAAEKAELAPMQIEFDLIKRAA